jgi:hypothetical protein
LPGEAWFIVALGALVVLYCGLYLMAQWLGLSPARREQINTGFRVVLLILVAAYLLTRIHPRGL